MPPVTEAHALIHRPALLVLVLAIACVLTASAQEAPRASNPLEAKVLDCEHLAMADPAGVMPTIDRLLADLSSDERGARTRLRLCRGEALMRVARYADALAEFTALHAEGHPASRLSARILLRLAAALVMQARVAEAAPHLAAAAGLIAVHGGDEERALLLGTEAVILQTEGRFELALEKFEASQQLLTAANGAPHLRALAFYNTGTAMIALGDKSGARAALAQAQQLATGGHLLAMVLGVQARLSETPATRQALLLEALRIEREIGSASGEALFLRQLGEIDVSEGRLEAAAERFAASLERTRRLGNDEGLASSLIALANVQSHLGQHATATTLGEEALTISARLAMPVVAVHVTHSLAQVHAQAGNYERALAVHEQFHAVANQLAEHSRSIELERTRNRHATELREQAHTADLQAQRFVRNVALGGAAVLLLSAFVLLRLLRQKAAMMREVVRQNAAVHAAQRQMHELGSQLGAAIEDVKRLSGLLPICAHCKSIRDDHGAWRRLEEYVTAHSEASFSHGICPECARLHYADH